MIFQDPMTSLNPVLTVEEQMIETIKAHRRDQQGRRPGPARSSCSSMVGIPQPETRLKSFPHQFSGGMRQRVMIAMALALAPKLMIADEPTTALDVTIQAQVLELLRGLTEQTGSAMILITHDLGVVAGMTNRINVMYAGYIVEIGHDPGPVRGPVAPVHGRPAAFDPAARRRRRRAAHPDRGPSAGHAPRADRLPVRAALPLAARHVLDTRTRRCARRSQARRSS